MESKNLLIAGVALVVIVFALALFSFNADANGELELPSIDVAQQCGEATLDFHNPTDFFFSFDYRIDNETGTDDEVTGLNIANGPNAGQPFGQRYNIVDTQPGTSEQRGVTFGEDTGAHTVAYRLWRGAENDWYISWAEVTVESDCEPNEEPQEEPKGEGDESSTQNTRCDDIASLTPDQARGDCGVEPLSAATPTPEVTKTQKAPQQPVAVDKSAEFSTLPSTGFSWGF